MTTLNSLITTLSSLLVEIKSQCKVDDDYLYSERALINFSGHPINVETKGGGVLTIPTAKDDKGNTWALKVSQSVNGQVTDKHQDLDVGGDTIAIHSRSRKNGSAPHLVLWCKDTGEEITVPFDRCYRYPSALEGILPIVSAMTGNCFASNCALLPMTAPHENPTRNEKGWIVSVKGLRFNEG